MNSKRIYKTILYKIVIDKNYLKYICNFERMRTFEQNSSDLKRTKSTLLKYEYFFFQITNIMVKILGKLSALSNTQ